MYMEAKIILLFLFCLITDITIGQILEGTSNPVMVDVSRKKETQEMIPVELEDDEKITLQTLGITKLPRYYALIIGVSNYQNSGSMLPDLEMPAKDAEKLFNVLTTQYAFEPADATLLTNPTREEIIDQFDRLAEIITDKDNLLIFYAGHGQYDKAKDFGFWLPADAKIESRSAWIANSTIKDYAGAIKSKHTLLISDACFGGSIFKTRSVGSVVLRFNDAYSNNSRKALTSGNLMEVPDQSIFIKYLLKSLSENKDLFLSSSALFARIYEPITNNAIATPQFGVIQSAGDEGGDFIFIKKK
jgi:hypothetical protein